MTREPIPVFGGPLYRFVLFRAGENSGGVLGEDAPHISDGWRSSWSATGLRRPIWICWTAVKHAI